eukprot:14443487-Heterocapsa_arctica.AAC.1
MPRRNSRDEATHGHDETPGLDLAIDSLIVMNYRPFSASSSGALQERRPPLPRDPLGREPGPPWATPGFKSRAFGETRSWLKQDE